MKELSKTYGNIGISIIGVSFTGVLLSGARRRAGHAVSDVNE
ncbi:hypothetical protein HM1_1733 [Heliomicrobium modesticaldum Ice1]|uniref:Uncharacterized protein n=1 Tax=Heliobacterium modesticaldum (strain ATCC 51547 / Ice1) TaxID=498761 RepID=B0TEQ1_HELMI|nr:hypothetical protein HM1_1733 [Heliomicrobium modesticaldum Ice1]